jgi:hydrogenase expression/formation protein HypE
MRVSLAAGGGGKAMGELIKSHILKHFTSPELANLRDASYLKINGFDGELAFATDSFVVVPEFFPGGNIGKVAVAGTVNDLTVSGAAPLFLSAAMVIPEGYSVDMLDAILKSMADTAVEAGVQIITGDTKVTPRGELLGIIINTAGIGLVKNHWNDLCAIKNGDKLIVTSDIARHGVAVILSRKELGFSGAIESDCNPLVNLLLPLHDRAEIHFARDATRGGAAAVLWEIADASNKGILLDETAIPIQADVAHFCEVLGFDPMAVANEGVAILVTASQDAEKVLSILKSHPLGKNAAICGEITDTLGVNMKTVIGGVRRVEMPLGEILPRIC